MHLQKLVCGHDHVAQHDWQGEEVVVQQHGGVIQACSRAAQLGLARYTSLVECSAVHPLGCMSRQQQLGSTQEHRNKAAAKMTHLSFLSAGG